MSEASSSLDHAGEWWRVVSRGLAVAILTFSVALGAPLFEHAEIRGVDMFQPGKAAAIIFIGIAVAVPLWRGGRIGWLVLSVLGMGWFSWCIIPAFIYAHQFIPALLWIALPGLLPTALLFWHWRRIQWLRIR